MGANILYTIFIPVGMNYDVVVVICQKSPTVGANSLVVRLNQVGATLAVALKRQLHRLRPLVKPTVLNAIEGIIVVAIFLYLCIICQVLRPLNQLPNIQILRHHGYRISFTTLILPPNGQVLIFAMISRIFKFSI